MSSKRCSLESLAREIVKRKGVEERALRGGKRSSKAARARRRLCQLTVKKLNYYGAEAARYLGMTTSAVNRGANAKELPNIKHYLKDV